MKIHAHFDANVIVADALQAATIENARIIRQAANLGSISNGKLADLVLLDADPLTDIHNTRKIFKAASDPKTLLKTGPVN